MSRKLFPSACLLLLFVVLVLLPGEARGQKSLDKLEARQYAEIPFNESTKRILDDHDLKREARKDPTETIIALDRLRIEGTEPTEEIAIAIAEVALDGAHRAPGEARAGLYLCAAAETFSEALEQAAAKGSSEITEKGPLTELGLQVWAVERLIDTLQDAGPEALGGSTVTFAGPLTEYRFRWVSQVDAWTTATHEFIGASAIQRKKKDPEGRRSGVGAPIVAVRKGDLPEQPVIQGGLFPIYEFFYALTAVLDIGAVEQGGPRQATLNIVDPHREDRFEIGSVDYPLAIDLGAQLVALEREMDINFSKGGTLRSGKHMDQVGLYAGAPLRTDKIPVVLVHGLMAGPTGWIPALEELSLDPVIRQKYQVWLFAYPTGLPWVYPARMLREALVETIGSLDPDGTNPLLQQTVIVGHSMGGLLTRVNVSDSGMVIWDGLFSVSPDEIDLEPADLEWMKESLIFESVPFITRAVFLSVPHRGSKLASNSVGKIGASFVPLPEELKKRGERIVLSAGDSLRGDAAEREKFADGVQSLQPESTAIELLNQVEINPRVTYHSIIGDQGKGDTPDSSDGVVAYWSSHLEGAASEKIVPSGHGTYNDLEGIAELQRILHLHLDSVQGGN